MAEDDRAIAEGSTSWNHQRGTGLYLRGPQIEDAMGRGRYLLFYLAGGLAAMLCSDSGRPTFYGSKLGGKRSHRCSDGRVHRYLSRDRIKAVLFIFVFVRITLISAALLIGFWFLTQLVHAGAVAQVQTGGVAYLAHVGRFVIGAVTARLFEGSPRIVDEPR
jgi:membrane associated rhomboid family serine protease